jgi:hypothetical protein
VKVLLKTDRTRGAIVVIRMTRGDRVSTVHRTFKGFAEGWRGDRSLGKVGDRVCTGWAIVLQRNGADWVPVPDLTYVSYDRLPVDWAEDAPCPVPPELASRLLHRIKRLEK